MWLLSWQNVCWGMRLPSQWLLCVLDLSGPPNHIQWSWLKSNSIIEKKLLLFEMKFSPKRFWNRKIICLFSYTCLRLLTVFLLLWWSFVLKKKGIWSLISAANLYLSRCQSVSEKVRFNELSSVLAQSQAWQQRLLFQVEQLVFERPFFLLLCNELVVCCI